MTIFSCLPPFGRIFKTSESRLVRATRNFSISSIGRLYLVKFLRIFRTISCLRATWDLLIFPWATPSLWNNHSNKILILLGETYRSPFPYLHTEAPAVEVVFQDEVDYLHVLLKSVPAIKDFSRISMRTLADYPALSVDRAGGGNPLYAEDTPNQEFLIWCAPIQEFLNWCVTNQDQSL